MKTKFIQSDLGRVTWLNQMVQAASAPGQFGSGLLPGKLNRKAEQLNTNLKAALTTNTDTLARIGKLVTQCRSHQTQISRITRLFWSALVLRTEVMDHSRETLKIYGLSINGARPRINTLAKWLETAEALVRSEERAVARGYPPMVNPGIDTLNSVLTGAREAAKSLEEARLAYQENLQTLNGLRKEVATLFRSTLHYFKYALADLDPVQARQVMRSYGFTFQGGATDDGGQAETPEPIKTSTEPVTTLKQELPSESELPAEPKQPPESKPPEEARATGEAELKPDGPQPAKDEAPDSAQAPDPVAQPQEARSPG